MNGAQHLPHGFRHNENWQRYRAYNSPGDMIFDQSLPAELIAMVEESHGCLENLEDGGLAMVLLWYYLQTWLVLEANFFCYYDGTIWFCLCHLNETSFHR